MDGAAEAERITLGELAEGRPAAQQRERSRHGCPQAMAAVPRVGDYCGGPALQTKEVGALSNVTPLLT